MARMGLGMIQQHLKRSRRANILSNRTASVDTTKKTNIAARNVAEHEREEVEEEGQQNKNTWRKDETHASNGEREFTPQRVPSGNYNRQITLFSLRYPEGKFDINWHNQTLFVLSTRNETSSTKGTSTKGANIHEAIILYRREDDEAGQYTLSMAEYLAEFLQNNLGRVFLLDRDIHPGSQSLSATLEAINQSQVVVLLICATYLKDLFYHLYLNYVVSFPKPLVQLAFGVTHDQLKQQCPGYLSFGELVFVKAPFSANIDDWRSDCTDAITRAKESDPRTTRFTLPCFTRPDAIKITCPSATIAELAAVAGDRTRDLSHSRQACYKFHQRGNLSVEASNTLPAYCTPCYTPPFQIAVQPQAVDSPSCGPGPPCPKPSILHPHSFPEIGERANLQHHGRTVPYGCPISGAIIAELAAVAGDRTRDLSHSRQACYESHQRGNLGGEASNTPPAHRTSCYTTVGEQNRATQAHQYSFMKGKEQNETTADEDNQASTVVGQEKGQQGPGRGDQTLIDHGIHKGARPKATPSPFLMSIIPDKPSEESEESEIHVAPPVGEDVGNGIEDSLRHLPVDAAEDLLVKAAQVERDRQINRRDREAIELRKKELDEKERLFEKKIELREKELEEKERLFEKEKRNFLLPDWIYHPTRINLKGNKPTEEKEDTRLLNTKEDEDIETLQEHSSRNDLQTSDEESVHFEKENYAHDENIRPSTSENDKSSAPGTDKPFEGSEDVQVETLGSYTRLSIFDTRAI